MSIYLDNAATTYPKPEQVYRAVESALRGIGVGPGRGGHRRSLEAARVIFETRESLARLFGVRESSRIIFTHSATEALNLAVKGFVKPGDHVVTSTMEHNSLARPLHYAEEAGVAVTRVEGDSDGYVSSEAIVRAIRPATRLVALSHCSNVTGAINPVEEIGRLLAGGPVRFLVDGAQSAGSVPIDLASSGIDLFAAAGHKGLYGPPGTGFLYIAPGVELEPLLVGGTGGGSSELEQPLLLPERYESGTLNTPAIAGLGAGVEFVASRGVAAIRAYEQSLVVRLISGLADIPGIRVYNRNLERDRGAVVSFTTSAQDPATIAYLLDHRYGIIVRVGLHCAPLAHRTIGTFPDGTIRVSPGLFNTMDDIDQFLEALASVLE